MEELYNIVLLLIALGILGVVLIIRDVTLRLWIRHHTRKILRRQPGPRNSYERRGDGH